MATQEEPKRKRPAGEPVEETSSVLEKRRAEPKAAVARTKEAGRVRPKAEETPPDIQEAAAAEQAQAEPARAELERTLVEARPARSVEAQAIVPPATVAEEQGAVQRVSFVVRVTVDGRGQPLRTEIEHATTKDKQLFAALDGEKLLNFMRRHIGLPAIPEPTIPPAPSSVRASAPTPDTPRPTARLTVSDVWVSGKETVGIMSSIRRSAEDLLIQVRFKLEGSQALALTVQAGSFKVKV